MIGALGNSSQRAWDASRSVLPQTLFQPRAVGSLFRRRLGRRFSAGPVMVRAEGTGNPGTGGGGFVSGLFGRD